MPQEVLLAIVLGVLTGASLGLTGGGGSTLALPILVYALSIPLHRAVIVSLAIVGITSLLGVVLQISKHTIKWKVAIIMSLGGALSVPLGHYLGSLLPENLLMLLFAVLMIYISIKMIWGDSSHKKSPELQSVLEDPSYPPLDHSQITTLRDLTKEPPNFKNILDSSKALKTPCLETKGSTWFYLLKLFSTGILTGLLSGLFGIGGGMLIVPALLFILKLSIAEAMSTSLLAIFLISSSSIFHNFETLVSNYNTKELCFFAGSILGMSLGVYLKKFIPARLLKTLFGIMILVLAAYVIYRNLF